MQDITEALLSARAHGSWPIDALCDAHAAGTACVGLRVEWDSSAGEEWLRLLKTSTLLGLVWVPGPFLIETSGHQEIATELARVMSVTPNVVVVPHIDSPVLSVRPTAVWPDRDWPVGAVDPTAMSAHDLWYATS